ncbi:hypothetical protein [Ruegeria sp. HKCCD6109]|uniref:hypothetical protein n=1 Tax=Ruegeria sp. HKCCD6109 TaxID=2683017 RepID=UPI0014909D6D|nr:hypothetical protein [Ruegeria sp. HKCCD6109]NOD65769.1 hypothetical protein [Ruegeria sp. HKCCD6109]
MSTEHMKAILQCVEAGEWLASGDGDDMWLKFHDAFEGGVWSLYHARALDAFNGSLDAAKALHEALLPDYTRSVDATVPEWGVTVSLHKGGFPQFEGDLEDEARAWLVAILKALIAKGDADG